MNCKDCNKNINPSPDSASVWTGGDFPDFGIENNTSMKTVVTQLIKQLVKATTPVQNIGKTTDEVKVSGTLLNLTGKVSPCSSEIVNRNFRYSIKPGINGIELTYDLNETLQNLPSIASNIGVNTLIVGKATYGPVNILDSKKEVGGVSVPVDRFPATATFKVFLTTTCGNIELIKRVVIDSTGTGNFNSTFDINDAGNTKEEYNQTEANTLIISALNNATREIGNLKAEITELKAR